jgi:hypothetical protein
MYVFDPAQPHVALDTAATLDSIAMVLASRPEPGLTVCVNQDGLSRALNSDEQHQVDQRTRELRSLTGEGP